MFTPSLRFTALVGLLVAATTSLPSQTAAQQAAGLDPGSTVSSSAATTSPAPVGPRVAPADFVRWAPASGLADAMPPQDRIRKGPNIAMMAVGGAALVVGLIIGGDGGLIIATTGGVIGLVGLYRYLR